MAYVIGFFFGVVITSIFFVIRQRKILQKVNAEHKTKLESDLRHSKDENHLKLKSLQKQHELQIKKIQKFNEVQLKKQATIIFVETLVKIWTDPESINTLTVTYASLKNHLSNKEWEKADKETATIIFNACNPKNSYLEIEEITALSPELLLTVDYLWLYYSQNRFGFSIQKEVLKHNNSSIPLIEEEWRKIGELLGWHKNGAWISGYNQLNCSQNAPRGQFPFFVLWKGTFWGSFIDSQSSRFTSLMNRFSDCKLDFH